MIDQQLFDVQALECPGEADVGLLEFLHHALELRGELRMLGCVSRPLRILPFGQ